MVQILTAITAVFVLFSAWVAVQHWARRADNLPEDCDIYGDTGKDCRHCGARRDCHKTQDIQATDEHR